MPASQTHHLHPLGWESDPEEERYKISTLDYLSVCSYNNYALFCRLDDAAGTFVVDILKAGLERTLRDSTARLVVQWLNSDPEYPSIDEIEEAHFSATKLGDLNTWSANFVRGGLVFIMLHHYANDMMGWAEPAEEDKSKVRLRHSGHKDQLPGISLLFHLPKSKAAELKRLATPEDGTWLSTYDAFSVFILRTLTRVRGPVFNPDPSDPLFWAEAVDMRRRMHSPRVPPRIQGNVVFAAKSTTVRAYIVQPTISEIISDWPFWKLASYIRSLTNSVTQENLDGLLRTVARVRDKTSLNIRIDLMPPMSLLQTDHRDANATAADFGFARPITYRHLLDCVTNGVIGIYPPRMKEGRDGEDERGVDGIDAASTSEVPKYIHS
ncbi:hypothetical protein BDW68DRAFT_190741 [Aspergillus falconensis]